MKLSLGQYQFDLMFVRQVEKWSDRLTKQQWKTFYCLQRMLWREDFWGPDFSDQRIYFTYKI